MPECVVWHEKVDGDFGRQDLEWAELEWQCGDFYVSGEGSVGESIVTDKGPSEGRGLPLNYNEETREEIVHEEKHSKHLRQQSLQKL